MTIDQNKLASIFGSEIVGKVDTRSSTLTNEIGPMSTHGQNSCGNCGWSGLQNHDPSDKNIKRSNDGDALCPECNEVCHTYDYRD